MVDLDSILRLIEKGETQTVEFKQSQILSNSSKLAKTVTGMANAEGGVIFIGVTDDKEFEGMPFDKKDEEKIMHILRDKCQPRLLVEFSSHEDANGEFVYRIEVPEKENVPYAVKTKKDGLTYFIRHGTETIPLPYNELERYFRAENEKDSEDIETPVFRPALYDLGKYLLKITNSEDKDLKSIQQILVALGSISMIIIIIPLVWTMVMKDNISLDLYSKYTWPFVILFLTMGSSFRFSEIIGNSKCPECNRYFAFSTIKKNGYLTKEKWTKVLRNGLYVP